MNARNNFREVGSRLPGWKLKISEKYHKFLKFSEILISSCPEEYIFLKQRLCILLGVLIIINPFPLILP